MHVVCDRHGWNDEIKLILKEFLKNKNDGNNSGGRNHDGLFHEDERSESPLDLSLQSGSDLGEIFKYLNEEHPTYFKANLGRVSRFIAEYCHDMDLLSGLIHRYGGLLLDSFHPLDGSSPLHFACHYQNEGMIIFLLEEYLDHNQLGKYTDNRCVEGVDVYDSLLSIQNRLLLLNNEGISPLGHLLLNVGDLDAENAWRCIGSCTRFFTENNRTCSNAKKGASEPQRFKFPILHLFLSNMWSQMIAKKNCMKILDQIVNRLGIDVCGTDQAGNTVLNIVIEKLSIHGAASHSKETRELTLQILDYFVNPTAIASNTITRCPSVARDGSGRLPLHAACEQSLSWKFGLEKIVRANMPALELNDPITGLPPFAHYATDSKSDLDSIFELLRLHPGILDSVLS